MSLYKSAIVSLGVAAVVAGSVRVGSGQAPAPRLPGAPIGTSGQSVTPAMEGWFKNPDGSSTVIIGYYNRNSNTEFIDVPIGPNNKIEPGGPDQGQPTHFLGRRQWGMFSVTLPKDNGNKKLTWTLVSNGQSSSITIWPNPPYSVDPFKSEFNGNTPPVIKLEASGPELKGPPRGVAKTYAAAVNQPLTLTLWVKDAPPTIVTGRGAAPGGGAAPATQPAAGAGGGAAAATAGAGGGRGGRGGAQDGAGGPGGGRGAGGPGGPGAGGPGGGGGGRGGPGGNQLRLGWARFRGPAEPKFAAVNPTIAPADGKAETTVTFPEAGEYWLRAQFNDSSGEGGGGDQCCWSSILVKVNVK